VLTGNGTAESRQMPVDGWRVCFHKRAECALLNVNSTVNLDRGLMQPCGIILVIVPVVAGLAVSEPATARRLPSAPRLIACPFTIPDDVNVPQALIDADDDDSDDSDDSDDDGAGDSDSSAGPAWQLPGGGCVAMTGNVTAGVQANKTTGVKGALINRAVPVTVYTSIGTLDYSYARQLDSGFLIGRVSADLTAAGGTTGGVNAISQDIVSPSRISLTFRSITAGIETSFFDSWSGDEFTFRALAPSQSPGILAWTMRPDDATALSVSLEDTVFRKVTVSGYAGTRLPDVVGRYRRYADPFDLTVSVAARQTRLINPDEATLNGGAVQVSLKRSLPMGDDSYVIVQGAYAVNALGYLGINTTNSAFSFQLPGVLGANVAERGNGWNLAGVFNWTFAEKWRSAAFVSAVSLDLPRVDGTGRLRSVRGAANITFSPSDSLDMTLELGYARLESGIPLIPSLRQTSLIASMATAF